MADVCQILTWRLLMRIECIWEDLGIGTTVGTPTFSLNNQYYFYIPAPLSLKIVLPDLCLYGSHIIRTTISFNSICRHQDGASFILLFRWSWKCPRSIQILAPKIILHWLIIFHLYNFMLLVETLIQLLHFIQFLY